MESKEIKAYDRLFDSLLEGSILTDEEKLRYNEIVSNALTEKQELEKFARLVVTKQFNFDRYKYTQLHWKTIEEQVDVYNSGIGNSCKLTQAEFDFAKEMIKKYE